MIRNTLSQEGSRLKSLSLGVNPAQDEISLFCSQYVLLVLLYSPVVSLGQKKIYGINMHLHKDLFLSIREKTLFDHPVRDEPDISHQVRLPIHDEMSVLISLQLTGDPTAARNRS